MEYLSKFPERLHELMFYHEDIKADALGEKIGISGGTIRSWLRGDTLISTLHAIQLADFFHCSLDYLAGRKEVYEEVLPRELPPLYPQIRKVLAEYNITRYRITVDTAIKDSHFTNWSNGKVPKLLSMCILANYLHVSLDYLIGRSDY